MFRLRFALLMMAAIAAFSLTGKAASAELLKSLDGGGKLGNLLTRGSGEDSSFWVNAEYLLWQTTGMKLPPLVTGNPLGTPADEAGVIGVPSTTILLGNDKIFDSARSGIRYGGGVWLTDRIGLSGDYFSLGKEDVHYRFDGTGDQIIGRPFINLAPLAGPIRWDTQLNIFPPIITGYTDVRAFSKFQGAGGLLIFNVLGSCGSIGGSCCDSCCDVGCDSACCQPTCGALMNLNLTLGYRHLSLKEGVRIDERLESAADVFELYDVFNTESSFHGIEFGIDYNYWCCNFGVSMFGRFGVGNTNNQILIDGQTAIDGNVEAARGGILAQSSNIGFVDHNVASMIAQLGFNLHVQLTPCLSAGAGYSVLYWGNVARAGEQIDMNVHPGLFPPPVVPVGTIGAQGTHRLSDFLAHGLNLGLTLRF